MLRNRNLVLCKGIHEYIYAKSLHMSLPRQVQPSVAVLQSIHHGDSIDLFLKEAVRLKKESVKQRDPYGTVWVLAEQNFGPSVEVQSRLALNGLNAAYCPICMEQWYMLHFEDYDPSVNSKSEAVNRLLVHWPQYKRNGIDAYEELKENVSAAIARADKANKLLETVIDGSPPAFTVQHLLDFFTSLKLVA